MDCKNRLDRKKRRCSELNSEAIEAMESRYPVEQGAPFEEGVSTLTSMMWRQRSTNRRQQPQEALPSGVLAKCEPDRRLRQIHCGSMDYLRLDSAIRS